MKVLFVYPNMTGSRHINISIAYLSSYIKSFGHKTKLIDTTFGWDREDILKQIRQFKPDLIGFSVLTTGFDFSLELAELIKKNFDIPIIFGGIHPTLDPEGTIKNENVDIVCIGEGEQTLLELIEKMEAGKNINKIQGLWIKKNKQIFKNPLRPLFTELDKLPFPDRELFDRRYFTDYTDMPFLTSRGCPYQCTYCCNFTLQKMYNFKNFVRFRSAANILEEMKLVKKKFNMKSIFIIDDNFTLRKEKVVEFCKRYSKEIGLSFICNGSPLTLDEETVLAMKNAGCQSINVGIESGNDEIRQKIMKRPYTKSQLINVFTLARKAGIKTHAFNIIGVPGETRATIMESIMLNKACKPTDCIPSIFYPFPFTELWHISKKGNFMTDRRAKDYYSDSILNLPTIGRKDLIAMQKVFQMYVGLPEYAWPIPFVLEKMIRYSPMRLNNFYTYLTTSIFMMFFAPAKSKLMGRAFVRIKEKISIR